jgi:predicted enzyme related to lactoylglutathione lyase
MEIAATNMDRCQKFYKAVFGWEFTVPEMPMMPPGGYAIFTKPGTALNGGIHGVKEENIIKPKVDETGRGQNTNKFIFKVEEVTTTLESIKKAGGEIIR